MSRDISAAISSALDDDVIKPFFAVELLFDGNKVLRLWTGIGTLSYEGNDWAGAGVLLNISTVEETSDLGVRGAVLSMSGVPSSVIALALTEPYQGRVANVYFGINPEAAQSNLTKIFSGYMDQMNIAEDADTSTIELSIENKLIDLERPRTARFTSAYQKSVFPGDLGLDFVEDLQDKEIVWGRSAG